MEIFPTFVNQNMEFIISEIMLEFSNLPTEQIQLILILLPVAEDLGVLRLTNRFLLSLHS